MTVNICFYKTSSLHITIRKDRDLLRMTDSTAEDPAPNFENIPLEVRQIIYHHVLAAECQTLETQEPPRDQWIHIDRGSSRRRVVITHTSLYPLQLNGSIKQEVEAFILRQETKENLTTTADLVLATGPVANDQDAERCGRPYELQLTWTAAPLPLHRLKKLEVNIRLRPILVTEAGIGPVCRHCSGLPLFNDLFHLLKRFFSYGPSFLPTSEISSVYDGTPTLPINLDSFTVTIDNLLWPVDADPMTFAAYCSKTENDAWFSPKHLFAYWNNEIDATFEYRAHKRWRFYADGLFGHVKTYTLQHEEKKFAWDLTGLQQDRRIHRCRLCKVDKEDTWDATQASRAPGFESPRPEPEWCEYRGEKNVLDGMNLDAEAVA